MSTDRIEQTVAASKPKRDEIPGRHASWAAGGYLPWQLSAPKPGTKPAPGSNIKPEEVGKIPGKMLADGACIGWKDWTKPGVHLSEEGARTADKWDMNVSIKTDQLPFLDADIDNPTIASEVRELAFKHFGRELPQRDRSNSSRFGMLFRGKDFRKRRAAFIKDGKKAAVELLGETNQFIAEGTHPSGGKYKWRRENHPCELRPEGLPELKVENVERFFAGLTPIMEKHGYKVLKHAKLRSTPIGPRRSFEELDKLEHPDHAPDPQDVLDALKFLPNEYDYDDFIRMLAAIKHALGPSREEFFLIDDGVMDWILQWGENDADWAQDKWDSITDASLGWNWLYGEACAKGYDADRVQRDFAVDPPPEYSLVEARRYPTSGTAAELTSNHSQVTARGVFYQQHFLTPDAFGDVSLWMIGVIGLMLIGLALIR
jgi:hypothetical protein